MTSKKSGLYLVAEGIDRFRKLLVDSDGTVLCDEVVSPHDELINFMDRPMSDYIKQIKILEQHALFEESLDISVNDFTDVVNQSFALSELLRGDFHEAYCFTKTKLADILLEEDDGSAMYLLNTGFKLLNSVRLPYYTKTRMRNVMEVCFGTTDGFTNAERHEKVCAVYPILREHAFSTRWLPGEQHCEYEVFSLFEYYAFMLMAALRSDNRIVRCKHCWNYFVPRTKKKTDYCYRQMSDGKTCGAHGANLKRYDGQAEDKYLAAYKKLHARFYEREYRAYANEPTPRGFCFEDWMEIAHVARKAYLSGTIDGEELLHRLNLDNEPIVFVAEKEKQTNPLSEDWQSLTENDISFNPDTHFEGFMFLDTRADGHEWRTITATERAAAAKHGIVSLREKYRGGDPS